MKEKVIRVTGYGLFCLSLDPFQSFLREHKIGTKKLNKFFDKEKSLLEDSMQVGSWLPVSKISSVRYIVEVSTKPTSFDSEWQEVLTVNGCNLTVGEGAMVWVGTLDMLDYWNADEFEDKESISYQTMDEKILYKAYRFNVIPGKYKVTIRGCKKINIIEYSDANYLFLFELQAVNKFEDFTNPLTQNVNIAKM